NEEMSEICTKLWFMDENYCVAGEDYEIDLQGKTSPLKITSVDRAKHNLFAYFDEDRVFSRPTYKAFRALLDNYEAETGNAEVVTQEEFSENVKFINLIMETAVMKEVHQFLVDHDKAPAELDDFKRLLYKIWFKLYRRSRNDRLENSKRDLDSSGFEHVFVGETRDHDVTGFHNWLQFYLQEKKGNIDYKGYFRRGTVSTHKFHKFYPKLITLQFVWNKMNGKPIGSSFIGTSPEFEIGLYTLIFLMDIGERVMVNMADYEVELTVFRLGKGIGSAFPVS
ncbi:hypothetical protein CAPTEDRAFT_76337, partial [Capitella teleta]